MNWPDDAMHPPYNVNEVVPATLSRVQAIRHLNLLIAGDDISVDVAKEIWNVIIGPMYDMDVYRQGWHAGHCRKCSVTHPGLWRNKFPWFGHQMRCPLYVGEVKHHWSGINPNFSMGGTDYDCSCGAHVREYDWKSSSEVTCPNAEETWRGPRPEEEEED